MADLMSQMSKSMQVISITHLPQVAAKGSVQLLYLNRKHLIKHKPILKELLPEERIR